MMLDFTQSEIDAVSKQVNNRWRDKSVAVHLADIEVNKPGEKTATAHPALVWEQGNSTFIIIKMAAFTYKSFFHYLNDKRFDTGVDEYHDLSECADKLLKAQADFILSKNTKGLKVELNKS